MTAATDENSEDGESVEAVMGKHSEDGDRVEDVGVRGRKRPGCEGELSVGDSQNSGSKDYEENCCLHKAELENANCEMVLVREAVKKLRDQVKSLALVLLSLETI